MTRSRGFIFTCNNYTEDDLIGITELMESDEVACPPQYLVFGYEIGPECGTPHLQGYVYYRNPRYLNSLQGKYPFNRCSVRVANGNADQNFVYCSKTHEYVEFGKKPDRTTSWEKIQDVMADPKSNPDLYTRYRKAYKEIITMDKMEDRSNLTRQLILMDQKHYIPYLLKYGQVCTDPNLYDGEPRMVIPFLQCEVAQICHFLKRSWKIRRGYEIIQVDPVQLIVTYGSGEVCALIYELFPGKVFKEIDGSEFNEEL